MASRSWTPTKWVEAVIGDDTWRHVRVTLKPFNLDSEEITLTPSDEDDVRVIGELAAVLK